MKNNANYIYDVEYDVVQPEDNMRLYDLYIEKLQHSIYQKKKCTNADVDRWTGKIHGM